VLVVLVASTWIGLAVTALVLRWTWRRHITAAEAAAPDPRHD
jgi:putative effector of murein hydrolase LrgA (UPF0299 family)